MPSREKHVHWPTSMYSILLSSYCNILGYYSSRRRKRATLASFHLKQGFSTAFIEKDATATASFMAGTRQLLNSFQSFQAEVHLEKSLRPTRVQTSILCQSLQLTKLLERLSPGKIAAMVYSFCVCSFGRFPATAPWRNLLSFADC